MDSYSSSSTLIQVSRCLQAAQNGNLTGVKEQTDQLLHSSDVSPVGREPVPASLYESLSVAIKQDHRAIVEHLLNEQVAGQDFPADTAVRARAFNILELFLARGWNVNQPDRDMPPVLGYDFQIHTLPISIHSYLGSPYLTRLTRKWPFGCSNMVLILTKPATWT
jgi:hypothetical protein